MTLSALLSKRSGESPKKTCIKFEKKKFLYSEIDEIVTLTAGGLRSLGLSVKDRAAILMENCPEYIISYFAILRAGGVVVPVNTFLTAQEISYILKDCGCKVLIYGNKFFSYIDTIKKDILDIKALKFNEIPKIPSLHTLSKNPPSPLFIKGGMLTHKNLISNAEACVKVMYLSNKDRVLLFLPLFHSFTFTVCVIVPIYVGASIILLASVKPFSKVISSVFKDRITLFVAVPTIYNILARRKMTFFSQYIFRYLLNIRACVSGAAALPGETLSAFERRFKVPLLEGYGLTEASPVVSVNPLNGVRKPRSVGPPLPGVEAATVGEDGRLLEKGKTGELIVKGPNVME